jgi:hypothetical protein
MARVTRPVLIDGMDAPIVVYSFSGREGITDLSGRVHHYTDTVVLHILTDTYDDAHDIYCCIERAMQQLMQVSSGYGEWIFSVLCVSAEMDASLQQIDLICRSMELTVQWCEL